MEPSSRRPTPPDAVIAPGPGSRTEEPADGRSDEADSPAGPPLARQIAACAVRALALLVRGRLHLRRERVGTAIVLPNGRPYLVFRESTCDLPSTEPDVTLLVWFQLKGTGPSHPWRAYTFERESILNTLLYAGCHGFARKLWLVDRSTGGYAGLYTWHGHDAALRYGAYITAVLWPLSVPGSVGATLLAAPLPD